MLPGVTRHFPHKSDVFFVVVGKNKIKKIMTVKACYVVCQNKI